jgi:hypothetical protein
MQEQESGEAVVVVMLSEEEMDKEDVPVEMNIRHACELESVVGVERQSVYPPHPHCLNNETTKRYYCFVTQGLKKFMRL